MGWMGSFCLACVAGGSHLPCLFDWAHPVHFEHIINPIHHKLNPQFRLMWQTSDNLV